VPAGVWVRYTSARQEKLFSNGNQIGSYGQHTRSRLVEIVVGGRIRAAQRKDHILTKWGHNTTVAEQLRDVLQQPAIHRQQYVRQLRTDSGSPGN